jgi:hypothetical protein
MVFIITAGIYDTRWSWGRGLHLSTPMDPRPPHLTITIHDDLALAFGYGTLGRIYLFSSHNDIHRRLKYGSWEVPVKFQTQRYTCLNGQELATLNSIISLRTFRRTLTDGILESSQLPEKISRFLTVARFVAQFIPGPQR